MDAIAPSRAPDARIDRNDDTLMVRLSGDWTMSTSQRAERALSPMPDDDLPADVAFSFADVGSVDSAGAWIIHLARAKAEAAGRKVRLAHCTPELRSLLDQVVRYHSTPYEKPSVPPIVIRALTEIGRTSVVVWRDALQLVSILGVLGTRLAVMFSFTHRLRTVSILSNFDKACRGAVPITMLMSFLIGLIITQQGGFYLRTFGADLFTVDLVGVLVLREIGVLLAAILVAGRSGSAFTAEIGAMRMREEVDALQVIGVDPVEVLVVPRLIALILALPVLAFLSDIAALAGAILVAWSYLGIPPDLFLQRLNEAVTPLEFWIGIAKAPFMALIIGLVACNEGLKVRGSTESLGRRTTSAVVKAIFLVIVVDGLFAIFFAAIGL